MGRLSSKTFSWKNYRQWSIFFEKFIINKFDEDILQLIKIHKNELIYYDWVDPLDKSIKDEFGNYTCQNDFAKYFLTTYDFINVYHGCRPEDVDSYYKFGLKLLNKNEKNTIFKSTLSDLGFNISSQDFKNAIKKMSRSERENKIYFVIDDRELLKLSGGYTIYGSEYILGLVTKLSETLNHDLKKYLRNIGRPTIFKVTLPTDKVDKDAIKNLFTLLFTRWVYNKANNRKDTHVTEFAFELFENIEPQYISGHYHPKKIVDPYKNYMIYNVISNTYSENIDF